MAMNLDTLNVELEARSARERLAWAVETYGDRLLFTSSFGPGSGVLLHLWSEVAGELPCLHEVVEGVEEALLGEVFGAHADANQEVAAGQTGG